MSNKQFIQINTLFNVIRCRAGKATLDQITEKWKRDYLA